MKSIAKQSKVNIYQRFHQLSLGTKILIFMAIGILAGIVFGERAQEVQPLGDLFIRLLMMAAIPLVFFNLLAGLTSLSDLRSLKRIAVKIFVYYLFTTISALTLGLSIMHLLKPGIGMQLTGEVEKNIGEVPKVIDIFLDLVPENIFNALSTGKVTQIVVFAFFLGITTMLLPQNQRQPLQKIFELLAKLMRELINLLLHFAPIGIGALIASTVGQYGAAFFGPLATFIGGVWGAQVIMIIIYMALLVLFTRQSPFMFLKRTAPLYATTAATCSSLASLAVSLEVAENRLKLPRSIYSFTLPLGAQINKDGSSIMLAGVLLFTAQAYNIEFSLTSQITIVLVGLLLTTGAGGIPGGGLIIALIFVQAFRLPLEIAVIVGGIYRFIDMGITTINCMGDMVGTLIVAHSETGYTINKSMQKEYEYDKKN